MYEMNYFCVIFDIGFVCGFEFFVLDVCVVSGY